MFGDFNMNDIVTNNCKRPDEVKKIAEILLKLLNRDKKSLITYKELVKQLKDKPQKYYFNKWFHGDLGDLSKICFFHNLPLISVIVVNQSNQKSSSGFF